MTPSNFDCDLFVIGAGSGGVRAARMAALRGVKVVVAEGAALGGTCVNLGCIPKKLYSYAAHFHDHFNDSHGFGWNFEAPTFDWDKLKSRRAAEITRLNGIYEGLLRNAGVTVVRGWARLVNGHTVSVHTADGEQRFTARHIILASGGKPRRAPVPGHEWALTSDDMFDLDPFPKRLVVLGGGYIACEFASIMQGLGAQVTLVHRRAGVLAGFDHEVAAFVTAEMQKKGVTFRCGVTVTSATRDAAGVQALTLSSGVTVEADAVLHATGRAPTSDGLGLVESGVTVNADGTVPIDERFQTNVPSVHAIGDLVGRMALTPVALGEAMVLIDQLFGDGTRQGIDYEMVPTAVFTHPNIGTVGLSEQAARERFSAVRIYRSDFKPLLHTLSGSTERVLMKIVVDDTTDRVVGMHMVGGDAGEVIQGFAVAVQVGITKAQLDRTIGIHPTAAEEFVTMRDALPSIPPPVVT
jgi:glutathione reductase (NADPH)